MDTPKDVCTDTPKTSTCSLDPKQDSASSEKAAAPQICALNSDMWPAQQSDEPVKPEEIPDFAYFGHIKLAGLPNTRDLGGMPIESGHAIAPSRLIRSGALGHGTEADFSKLIEEHHLARIVDFRTELERNQDPDPMEKLPGVVLYELPMFEEEAIGITRGNGFKDEVETFLRFGKNPFEEIKKTYALAVTQDAGQRALRRFFTVLLDADADATLWHCTEGKDRTGLAGIFLEYILGVSPINIRKDYLATNIFEDNWMEHALNALADHHIAKNLENDADALFFAHDGFVRAALEAIEQQFGSVDGYLKNALDLNDGAQEELRAKYLV